MIGSLRCVGGKCRVCGFTGGLGLGGVVRVERRQRASWAQGTVCDSHGLDYYLAVLPLSTSKNRYSTMNAVSSLNVVGTHCCDLGCACSVAFSPLCA